ncbi:MAG: sigma-54-dependent Fis family transcriptional regulator [Myxococcales bacterium]|nr:sigma-54-dependent Fis family transcriptional regulator [Myxococcales bacterium]
MDTETRDAATQDGWFTGARGRSEAELAPRLRILHHCELARVGAMSGPIGPAWLTVGRHEPPFQQGAAGPAPLDDPHVSRAQLRVRWLPDRQRFEVEPVASARRPLHLVELDGEAAATISGPLLLAPGSCVAIGDRVLLGLELAPVRAPATDRLGLVGETAAVWALRDEVRSVAQFGGSALVVGPTGAGKELVARALHGEGPRAGGPFVAVNCGALPEGLADSVFLGHRKGAFTGADGDRGGLFHAADGGTLFLDELGELPTTIQPRLLRVLQDGEVVPVGATTGRRVDVRVIGATHRDLEAEVRAGRLREDLYHRLAAHVVRVPSLAERRLDVPPLFVHLLRGLAEQHAGLRWLWDGGRAWRPTLPIGFVVDLMRRPYRGNVRELKNLAEQTARLNVDADGFQAPPSTVTRVAEPEPTPTPAAAVEPAAALPEARLRAAGEAIGLAPKTVRKLLPPGALLALAVEAERERLDEAGLAARLRARAAEALLSLLEARGFNQSAVAAALGTSRTTAIRLMEELGLPRATDLDAAAIERACAQVGGDLDAAARVLRVSPSALKKRVTLANLKARG